jgi:hypothetical protein
MLQRKHTMRLLAPVLGALAVAVLAVGASASRDARWYVGINLRVVALGAQPPEPPRYGPRQH